MLLTERGILRPTQILDAEIEVLRDAVPRVARVTILWEPEYPGMELYRREADRAAKAMAIRLTLHPVRTLPELESALTLTARERPDGGPR